MARARVDAGLLRGLVLIDMAVHQGQMAKFFGGTTLVMVVVMAVVVVVVMVHRVVGQWWDLGIVTGKSWWIIAVAVIVVVVVVIVLLLLNIVSEILALVFVLVLGIIGLCRFKVGLDSSVGCIYGAGHRGHHLLARHTAILTLALAALE